MDLNHFFLVMQPRFDVPSPLMIWRLFENSCRREDKIKEIS